MKLKIVQVLKILSSCLFLRLQTNTTASTGTPSPRLLVGE